MTHLLLRLFFEHFQTTSFIVEDNGSLAAFLVGFVSQTHPKEAYIHFVGVNPEMRKSGVARQLYDKFFLTVRTMGCQTVRCIIGSGNRQPFAQIILDLYYIKSHRLSTLDT